MENESCDIEILDYCIQTMTVDSDGTDSSGCEFTSLELEVMEQLVLLSGEAGRGRRFSSCDIDTSSVNSNNNLNELGKEEEEYIEDDAHADCPSGGLKNISRVIQVYCPSRRIIAPSKISSGVTSSSLSSSPFSTAERIIEGTFENSGTTSDGDDTSRSVRKKYRPLAEIYKTTKRIKGFKKPRTL